MIEVKHFYLPVHYLFVDMLQQVRLHNLRYERSLWYWALAVNSVVPGRTVPDGFSFQCQMDYFGSVS